jgi:hypothetical protein
MNSRPPAVDRMGSFAVAMFLLCFTLATPIVIFSGPLAACLVMWCILVSWGATDGWEVLYMYFAELKRKFVATAHQVTCGLV